MTYPIGILVAISALVVSVMHLNQDAKTFWDFVGFATVFGGTLAVAIITIPWQNRRIVARAVFGLFVPGRRSSSSIVSDCIEYLADLKSGSVFSQRSEGLAAETMRDGAELISLGFTKDRVHEILEERIHQAFERYESVANAIRSLAKYPPAFGLAGTVLGLVTLMKGVSAGADAKQTGALMAIALMATFYGLLVANMIINPAGEHMLKTAKVERKKAEIALHAVLLHLDGVSMLEAQEILNSYVNPSERVNVMSGKFNQDAEAAA
ncbi:MAG: MotA/TolQ/ExbB proton channel family protein [Deltaproteobacteria bacterium]|jgi:chemotaxis protein MotA|nr:MotA/TolQ/ExbB proton channel family protein [Deltaproteobacteria bacterium]